MMQFKFLATAVAAVSVLVSATAFAQGDQPPAPAPAQPAPAAPGVTATFGSQGGTVTPSPAPGQDTAQTGQTKPEEKKEEKKPLPWHGTTFLWSQYATTQTVGLGNDYQSSNPLYDWWLVFRPRYYFLEDGMNTIQASLRFDVTLEFTNSDATTRKNEAEFGNIWILGGYTRSLYKSEKGWATKLSTGPRVLVPTSKSAWNAGTRLMPGWSAAAAQSIPLAGKGKAWFSGIDLTGSVAYAKFINKSTTAYNPDFSREATDTGGRVFVNHQYSGGALTNHQVLAAAMADLHITEKLTLSIMQYWIMAWKYKIPTDQQVQIQTGSAAAGGIKDPSTFTVNTWFYPTLDYDLIDELSLGVGYYNYTNQIGGNGERRNILWSPDAVVLFDITAHLDELYTDIAKSKDDKAARKANYRSKTQQARQKLIENHPTITW